MAADSIRVPLQGRSLFLLSREAISRLRPLYRDGDRISHGGYQFVVLSPAFCDYSFTDASDARGWNIAAKDVL